VNIGLESHRALLRRNDPDVFAAIAGE